MRKIFLDTDVIIDFLTKREPFSIESLKIFEYSARGKIKLFISSVSTNNIRYIISRIASKKEALEKIKALLALVEILPVKKSTIEKSILSKFKDFEDGLQNYCALEGSLNVLITRNVKDYSNSELSILTPKEFLAEFELSG